MGSEGYLINQFIAARTNKRTDEWGGSFDNRTRLATSIVERVRAATSPEFIVMFRLSMLDLVEGGSDWPEVVALAQAIEKAGATVINTGIGWHEARIPTIATSVPRGGFAWVTEKLRGSVSVPLVATNRIVRARRGGSNLGRVMYDTVTRSHHQATAALMHHRALLLTACLRYAPRVPPCFAEHAGDCGEDPFLRPGRPRLHCPPAACGPQLCGEGGVE